MYSLLRRLLFFFPAERAHYLAMNGLQVLCALPPVRRLVRRAFTPRHHPVTLMGLNFRNTVGLGAGFDKNARYLRELDALGFGFVEIGTVTPRPQGGNPAPRLFRLPEDRALINRMGFNNEGVDAAARRLKQWRKEEGHAPGPRMLIGGNIGKNKDTPNERAADDYLICLRALAPLVDFFVVNVSSPNTPGLRALQEGPALRALLGAVTGANRASAHPRPVLLKVAPDLTPEALEEIAELAVATGLDGLVATNTTISREGLRTPKAVIADIGAGGLSGAPLLDASTACLEVLHRALRGRLPLIGSGGIFTPADAALKRAAGAVLIEVWTGFIYEGPGIVKKIAHSTQHNQL